MGDIYCAFCREPWDADCLHETVAEEHPDEPWVIDGSYSADAYKPYYDAARADFRARGCVAIGGRDCRSANPDRSEFIDQATDLLGGDIDGLVVEIEDHIRSGGTL